MESSLEVPQKTKTRITIWSSNSTPGHIPGKKVYLKRRHVPQCSQQHYSQQSRSGNNLNVHQCEWIKKIWYIYTTEYYSAIKELNNAICSNMDAMRDSYEVKSERERQIPHVVLISKIWPMNLRWNRISNTESRLVAAKEAGGREMGWEFGVSRHKLGGVLLYSIGNYI